MIKRIDDKEYEFILTLNEEEIANLIPMDKAAAINAENKDSLEFHTRMGFSEVGNQLIRGGTIRLWLSRFC
ncbi:MAG: hypothetical protein IJP92_05310 [Lachnospiraceae bacterium]|nr:hypothetical protein [Lachnospiraceae bacterium]